MKIQYRDIAGDYARYRTCALNTVENLIMESGISSASRILEIGCGTGNYISILEKRVTSKSVGVDPSPEMISQAMKRGGRVAFCVGGAENLGFKDGIFDFVFSVDVIHHVEGRAANFQEAFRVLKRGGLFASVTDSEETIRQREPLALYFPETVDYELNRYPTIDEMNRHSLAAGFTVIHQEIVETPFMLNNIERYSNKAFSCLRLISEESFRAGIEKLGRDLKNGPIACVSRNFIVWNRK
jgi:ubiquinone/menaquinone biosynthesis C-methylase UbiE